ncbi:MAG: lysidine tils n: trna(ile)-lysidine synthetase [Verrucomicrobiaceae bacterium]|nr:lysidine tils n: trna(ile)-lysidine synthetase [Verrucomicrobiaceae bacterium]
MPASLPDPSRSAGAALLEPLEGPAKRYLIGVSGGRDSVALLHALHGQGFHKLIVCHINHGLRGRASRQDATFVRKLAGRLGLAHEEWKADVAALAVARRASVETVAREVRLEFFAAMARKHRCPRVFLAHHAEDQAETVLMRVLRGTGIGGLAGMAEETPMTVGRTRLMLLRPLLRVRRKEIDAFLEAGGMGYREDATNAEAKATRNRVRNDLLPMISSALGQDVAPMLARLARIARRDDDLLSALSAALAGEVVQADGSLVLTTGFKAAHAALQHRVMLQWLQAGQVPGLTHEVIEQAVQLATQRDPARINLPGGLQVRRKAGRLRVAGQQEKSSPGTL